LSETPDKDELVTRFGTIYGPEEISAVENVIRKGAPTNGEAVRDFEKAFADYCGTEYAIAVTSGTTALNLGCVAAGIGPGDRVLVPAITWIATANAPALQGADIGFVDIDPETFNMDPGDLERKIDAGTKMVIPVHLYGQPCEMEEIMSIASDHDCLIMSDCAHSPGAEYRGRRMGSMADLGAFSFHMQKNISTLGEGGMLTTDDAAFEERARLYRSHGRWGNSHEFKIVGHNYRMMEIQGAVGRVQLGKLDGFNSRRIENARILTECLQGVQGVITPTVHPHVKHVFHLYNILLKEDQLGISRDDFLDRLESDYGIRAGKHYEPIHVSKTLGALSNDRCPVADRLGYSNITLPTHPRLREVDLRYMAEAVSETAGTAGLQGP
jgi:perosamine synthetase